MELAQNRDHMTKILSVAMGIVVFSLTSAYAGQALPLPTESALPSPNTSVAVRPITYDEKDRNLDGIVLAENTPSTSVLPEPAEKTDATLAVPTQTNTPTKNTVDVYASGGVGFPNASTNGTINNESSFIPATTTYAGHATGTNGVYGASADYTFTKVHQKPVNVSLGVAYVGTTASTVNGTSTTVIANTVHVAPQPMSYNLSSQAAFFEQRVAYVPKNHPTWQPYLVTGFGPTWNRLSNFNGDNGQVVPTIQNSRRVGAIPTDASQNYSNETNSSFGYEAGAGIQHPLTEHIAIAADYRYINFGKGNLGGIPGVPAVNNRISTSSIGENTAFLSLKASFTT